MRVGWMMTSEHTKEPWMALFVGDESDRLWAIISANQPVCTRANDICHVFPRGGDKKTDANARRIVACVNACQGISTSVLELQGVPSLELCKRLEQQRDELLDLLSRYGVYAPDEVQDEINSAIAKVHP